MYLPIFRSIVEVIDSACLVTSSVNPESYVDVVSTSVVLGISDGIVIISDVLKISVDVVSTSVVIPNSLGVVPFG